MKSFEKKNLNISPLEFKKFLTDLEKIINEKKFLDSLNEMRAIDENYYSENILKQELEKIIEEFKTKSIEKIEDINIVQILLAGNPELVFRLGIEAVRNNVRMIINIEDFCLAQNTFLVKVINDVAERNGLSTILNLKNLVKDSGVYETSKECDCTICFGISNNYHRLNKNYNIQDLRLYPYNIFELYMDSEELEEVRRGVWDYAMRNQFEIEIYDIELDIDDVIEDINRNGYGFCSILLSKDEAKVQKFKENVNSKYVFINENPFKKIKWEFNLYNN